ncbi:MAG TPA: DUF4145 domain-containing protein, partial [Bacteroidia bacterium]
MVKTELNKSIDEILQVICLTCKNTNRHKVLTSVDTSGKESMGDGDWFHWNGKFQIIECQGCENISFRSEHYNSEDMDEDGWIVNELIYPKRTTDTWNTKDFLNIPYNLRRIYRETIDCFNNENLTLCGAGVRALVEGLCKENGIIDGEIEKMKADGTKSLIRVDNLQGKINGLHEKGKLTKENAEILHEHRFLGNTAIHDLSAPTKEELSLALEIIEHIFDNLYEIPEKAMQLRSKRLRKNK